MYIGVSEGFGRRIYYRYIVVVKKTFRYSNVFFYNHLYPYSLIQNIIMESGINH
jgi:hypothetical protein